MVERARAWAARRGWMRLSFTLQYLLSATPWDTGVSPPELVAVIEGDRPLSPGSAIDIGCGTGTNSLYLARHGWRVTGVDFAAPAITRAQRKARATATPAGRVRFIQGDATRLSTFAAPASVTLALDMGCLHSFTPPQQRQYADGLARVTAPGALYLLYAFGPRELGGHPVGLTPEAVALLFAPAFVVEDTRVGADRRGALSAWYTLRRVAVQP